MMLQLGDSGIYRDASKMMKISVIRPLADLIAVVLVTLIVIWLEFWVPVRINGFWCNNPYIAKDQLPNTVSKLLLYVMYSTIAAMLIMSTELVLVFHEERATQPYKAPSHSTYYICGTHVHRFIIRLWHFSLTFIFGALSTITIADTLKYSIGELRPNFLATCQPDPSLCQLNDTITPVYQVTDAACQNNASSHSLRHSRASMPSTYAAWAFYTITWAIVYLQCRLHKQMRTGHSGGTLLVTLIQLILICSAILISWTRVNDNENHWYDVVVGGFIGLFVGLLTALFISEVQLNTNSSRKLAASPVLAPPSPEVATGFSGYGTTQNSIATPLHTSSTSGQFSQDDYCYHYKSTV